MEYSIEDKNHLSRCIRIASIVHENQLDKAGMPYILHPLRVMQAVSPNLHIMSVAILHDILEDSDMFNEMELLNAGIFPEVVKSILCLTKRKTESYSDYINNVANNDWACIVKINDMRDNSTPIRLDHLDSKTSDRLFLKYGNAQMTLWPKYSNYCKLHYGRII